MVALGLVGLLVWAGIALLSWLWAQAPVVEARHAGRAAIDAVLAHYVQDFAAAGYAQEVISACPSASSTASGAARNPSSSRSRAARVSRWRLA